VKNNEEDKKKKSEKAQPSVSLSARNTTALAKREEFTKRAIQFALSKEGRAKRAY